MDFDKKDGFSYLDGVPVRIAAKYCPLRPVPLPLAFDARFPTELLNEQYDFSLERKVLEFEERRMAELETAKARMEEASQEEEATTSTNNQSTLPLLTSDDILQPQPKQTTENIAEIGDSTKKINLSDFENDSSSPFDYMELQTINDLEVLSSVFQGQQCVAKEEQEAGTESSFSKSRSFPDPQSAHLSNNDPLLQSGDTASADDRLSCSYPSVTSTMDLLRNYPRKGHEMPCVATRRGSNSGDNDVATNSSLRVSRSFSDLRNVEDDNVKQEWATNSLSASNNEDDTIVKRVVVNNAHSKDSNSPSNGDLNCDTNNTATYALPDPYYELDENSRQIVDSITDMGFSQGQVARTVKHLGTDEKKVVDHLCQIQILEESGYDGLEAEAALHLHDYNTDEAKKFLDLVIQFQDLGFEKNAVKKALVQNKNDWNKTIDALLPSS